MKKINVNLNVNGKAVSFSGTMENLETLRKQKNVFLCYPDVQTMEDARKQRESQGFFVEREELKDSFKGKYYVRDYACGCHSHHSSLIESNWAFCPRHNFNDVIMAFAVITSDE